MRRICSLFLSLAVLLETPLCAATIKKAAAVAEQKQTGADAAAGTDLVGTAIGLFAGFQNLKKQEEALSNACAPSDQEIAFVNQMIQQYAMIGERSGSEMFSSLPPKEFTLGCAYEDTVAEGEGVTLCYDAYTDGKDDATKRPIWYLYPKASKAFKCPPDKPNCDTKDKRYYSNIYDIYGAMGWSDADLTPDELSAHSKLMAKIEECSPEVLKRKKQEMTGSLITGTLGSIGKKQNTAGIMQQVQGMSQNSAGGGAMGGILQVGGGLLPGLVGANSTK
jgi:hypothetical protein